MWMECDRLAGSVIPLAVKLHRTTLQVEDSE